MIVLAVLQRCRTAILMLRRWLLRDMERAYDLAAVAVLQRLAHERPEQLELLKSVTKRDVSVYSGTYDSVQLVLKRLNVPFVLNPTVRQLRSARLVCANCSGRPNQTLRQRAEPFVRDGGLLVSTDWTLENIVQACFPNTIGHKPGKNSVDRLGKRC